MEQSRVKARNAQSARSGADAVRAVPRPRSRLSGEAYPLRKRWRPWPRNFILSPPARPRPRTARPCRSKRSGRTSRAAGLLRAIRRCRATPGATGRLRSGPCSRLSRRQGASGEVHTRTINYRRPGPSTACFLLFRRPGAGRGPAGLAGYTKGGARTPGWLGPGLRRGDGGSSSGDTILNPPRLAR